MWKHTKAIWKQILAYNKILIDLENKRLVENVTTSNVVDKLKLEWKYKFKKEKEIEAKEAKV